jgi:hypothetical protein
MKLDGDGPPTEEDKECNPAWIAGTPPETGLVVSVVNPMPIALADRSDIGEKSVL